MKKEDIDYCLREGLIRKRLVDKAIVRTLLTSAEEKSAAAKMLPLNEKTATLAFIGLYESIRQLGDAKWWLLGYESLSHDASMKLLQESDVKEKAKLQKLDRFRRIRNDANYRGQKITATGTKEILEVWDLCSADLINDIKNRLGDK